MKLIYTTLLAFVLLFVFVAEGSSYSYSSGGHGRRYCGHGRRWHRCKPCYRECKSSQCGRRGRYGGYSGSGGYRSSGGYRDSGGYSGSGGYRSSGGYRGSGGYSGSGLSSYLYGGSDLGSYGGDYCPCKPGCACTDGKYWDKRRGKCVRRCRKDYCPGNQVCRCVKCVKKCPSAYSYGYQSSRCYAYRCRKQCACPKGKYLNKNGRCVRKCRSRFGGHDWNGGSG